MIYVMSDIHGNFENFEFVMEQINLKPEDKLYVLGDVIDRHPYGLLILQKLMKMGNHSRQNADKIALENELFELKNLLEGGTPIDELSPTAQEKVRKYFTLKKRGNKVAVVADNKAIQEANKYHGYFVLVSNKERDPFECLRKYRKRETIESFFEAEKQHADGTRARVWYTDTLRGRMFVQFVALCYYEYFSEEIRKLKKILESEINSGRLGSNELKTTKKLSSWVNNTPLYLQLQWFDAVERVEVSSKLRSRRWNTEVTACDNLYLQKIGLNPS